MSKTNQATESILKLHSFNGRRPRNSRWRARRRLILPRRMWSWKIPYLQRYGLDEETAAMKKEARKAAKRAEKEKRVGAKRLALVDVEMAD